jgi:competence protein ComEA
MKWLRDYFDMNRRQEAGVLTLAAIIVILFGLQYLWIYIIPPLKTDISGIEKASQKLNSLEKDSLNRDTNESKISSSNLFNFDPNTLDEAGFEKLGLSPIIASHIMHYREKGGHFYKSDDFAKIYGMAEDDFNTLKPFIVIESKNKGNEGILVDINTADSLQLLGVKGIGPFFASGILKMRRQLGAFVRKEQLMDIYGIDNDKYDFIKSQVSITNRPIKTYNINSATIDALKNNPYLRYKLASVIVKYREIHGPFKTIEELRNIVAIDEKLFLKIKPYVVVK